MALKKILIIDDDEDFVHANQELLEAFDYEVDYALGGTNGLEHARKMIPDLIILDIMMGYDTEGIDVARKLHNEPELKKTKVILVSGIVGEKKLSAMPKPDPDWLPVERVYEKPIDPKTLIGEIKKLLEPGL
ncbi:MAG: response regulator [Chitinivibrionales bacterium]|nr:response regulator [Chitinivibrionales bacterium]